MNTAYSAIFSGYTFDQKRIALVNRAGDYMPSRVIGGYRVFQAIRMLLSENRARVVSAKWKNYKSNCPEYDLPNIAKEQSYDECIRTSIKYDDLTVKIFMSDGDSFHGSHVGDRCEWVVELNEDAFAQLFEEYLDHDLLLFLQEDYEQKKIEEQAREMKEIFVGKYF